jgi:outer membrane protein OmpA-like peptidoglycan-associated protein
MSNRQRSSRATTVALFGAALLGVSLASRAAHAQETLGGYALEQLDPAPAGDDFFAVPAPTANGHLVPRGYLMFDYAADPLTLGTGEAVVSSQGFLRVDGSLALFDRLLLSLDVPVALVQSGDQPSVSGITLASPDGVEMSDVRFGVRARLFGQYRDPFQLGLGASVFFPTGGTDTFAGEGTARMHPEVSLGGRYGGEHAFFWGAAGGMMMRGPDNPHTITYSGGVGVALADDLVDLTAEVFAATQLGSDPPLSSPRITVQLASATSAELLAGAKLRVLEGFVVGVAAGPGIADGVGTPTARVIGMVGWAPVPERDRSDEDDDGDGVLNGRDACVDQKGVTDDDPRKNGCPPPDRDNDRIPDALDACPSLVGRSSGDPTQSGCPADYDRDGVPDSEDACPNQKGVSSIDPKRNGCPGEVDTDLDGIADRQDACPKAKGSTNEDPSKNGCPTQDGDGDGIADIDDACPNERGAPDKADKSKNGCPKDVRVTTGEIVILRQVHFKLGGSSLNETVDPVSDDLLTEVRDVILQHPEIQIIEVQGHADDTGTSEFNKQLSEQRAQAVRGWLVKKGIDAKRLVSRGYGATRPIATNQTDDGKAANRRVQFVIVKKK